MTGVGGPGSPPGHLLPLQGSSVALGAHLSSSAPWCVRKVPTEGFSARGTAPQEPQMAGLRGGRCCFEWTFLALR